MSKKYKYGVFSGPYFPVFRPEKTPYLDTFQAVFISPHDTDLCSLKTGYKHSIL